MTPLQAITTGTRSAAELLGLEAEIGTLEAGKRADLVLCEGDPLADIALLADPANVVLVAQGGTLRKNGLGT
jgi:imidazolonepropionase-like amidohydrolase